MMTSVIPQPQATPPCIQNAPAPRLISLSLMPTGNGRQQTFSEMHPPRTSDVI